MCWSVKVILNWPDCRNARDLGGLLTADGRGIRSGALLRSDNHDRLTPQGVQMIRDGGVSRILDLRWEWEAQKYRSPFADDPIYRNLPLITEEHDQHSSLLDEYCLRVDQSQAFIAAAFAAIADAPPGGVLLHCHAGQDRTGILTALALLVAGVPAEVVASDYALTEGCSPQVMLGTIAHLEDRFGGVEQYLLDGGVTEDQLQAVRTRLLE
jgi:protein tyrosine/serine phosphatase